MSKESTDATDRPEKPRWIGFAQLALIVSALAVALYFARAPDRSVRETTPGSEKTEPVVNLVQPVSTERALTFDLTGTVTLGRKVRVVSEVVGRVVWVSPEFINGGAIKANETFIRIDSAEFQMEVQVAAMAVAEAEARLRIEMAQAEDRVTSFERDNSEAQVPEQIRNPPSVAEAKAVLGKAQAALELAELRLARTSISLPYASRVVSSELEVGALVGPAETVGPSALLGVVYRSAALQVRVPVEQAILDDLTPAIGRSALVRTEAGTHPATVVRVSSVVAPRTRLASLFLEFSEGSQQDALPMPGAFAEVQITGPMLRDVYVLPESAARERGGIWVVRDGVLSALVPSAVGHTSDGWIVEAFDAGEGVVVGPLANAREGLRVSATPSAE